MPLPTRVQEYLDAIVQACAADGIGLASIILFGSAAHGGFTGKVSDVDLILILPDGVSASDRSRLRDRIHSLELLHGFRPPSRHATAFEAFVERLMSNDLSFFICTRGDLLSGSVARILNLRPAQAFFVDRIVLWGILSSAVTVWGEDLLPRIPLLPIRRRDVAISFFGLYCQAVTSAMWYPALPCATRYAMATLKHSLHSCYFCYHSRPAALAEEAGFFQKKVGPSRALEQLLALRAAYAPSFAFVARCIPALVKLHWRTARDNHFNA